MMKYVVIPPDGLVDVIGLSTSVSFQYLAEHTGWPMTAQSLTDTDMPAATLLMQGPGPNGQKGEPNPAATRLLGRDVFGTAVLVGTAPDGQHALPAPDEWIERLREWGHAK
jgi:hypothetical protein